MRSLTSNAVATCNHATTQRCKKRFHLRHSGQQRCSGNTQHKRKDNRFNNANRYCHSQYNMKIMKHEKWIQGHPNRSVVQKTKKISQWSHHRCNHGSRGRGRERGQRRSRKRGKRSIQWRSGRSSQMNWMICVIRRWLGGCTRFQSF